MLADVGDMAVRAAAASEGEGASAVCLAWMLVTAVAAAAGSVRAGVGGLAPTPDSSTRSFEAPSDVADCAMMSTLKSRFMAANWVSGSHDWNLSSSASIRLLNFT